MRTEHLHYCSRCRRIGRDEGQRAEQRRAAEIMRRLLRWAGPDGYAITSSVEDSDDIEAAKQYIAEAAQETIAEHDSG